MTETLEVVFVNYHAPKGTWLPASQITASPRRKTTYTNSTGCRQNCAARIRPSQPYR